MLIIVFLCNILFPVQLEFKQKPRFPEKLFDRKEGVVLRCSPSIIIGFASVICSGLRMQVLRRHWIKYIMFIVINNVISLEICFFFFLFLFVRTVRILYYIRHPEHHSSARVQRARWTFDFEYKYAQARIKSVIGPGA